MRLRLLPWGLAVIPFVVADFPYGPLTSPHMWRRGPELSRGVSSVADGEAEYEWPNSMGVAILFNERWNSANSQNFANTTKSPGASICGTTVILQLSSSTWSGADCSFVNGSQGK